ncbi:MAG: hypothetical protein LV468_02690 [Candidatus Nitrosotenuis sp.]|nr:hypothetical protein [Candidatus Nitrosotenuis sp.]
MKAKATYLAVGVGVILVGLAVFFAYSADQAKIRGFNFGVNLQAIQDDIKQIQTEFYSKKNSLDEKSITKEEFLQFSKQHVQKMESVISRYDELSPPDSFSSAVKLFKMSTEKQLESDRFLIEWIKTGDVSNKVRSDLLLQESFESELAGLASYNDAKSGLDKN